MTCGKFQVIHVPRGFHTFAHPLPVSFGVDYEFGGTSCSQPLFPICVSKYPQRYCSCGPEGPMYWLEWNVEDMDYRDKEKVEEHEYCEQCGDCTRCEAKIGYQHYCDDCMRCQWDCRCGT